MPKAYSCKISSNFAEWNKIYGANSIMSGSQLSSISSKSPPNIAENRKPSQSSQCLIWQVLIIRFTWFFVWVSHIGWTTSSASFIEISWKMTVIDPLSWCLFFSDHLVHLPKRTNNTGEQFHKIKVFFNWVPTPQYSVLTSLVVQANQSFDASFFWLK